MSESIVSSYENVIKLQLVPHSYQYKLCMYIIKPFAIHSMLLKVFTPRLVGKLHEHERALTAAPASNSLRAARGIYKVFDGGSL